MAFDDGDGRPGVDAPPDDDGSPDGDSPPDDDGPLGTDPVPDPFTLPVEAVQPSQLYLNGRKLSLVTQWFDFAEPNYDPLPIRQVARPQGGETWTLTDGHTRAFVAHLAGADELRVVSDTDDLPMAVYRRCVGWCEDEGVTEIGDLAGRVLNADEFEERWVERCRSLTE